MSIEELVREHEDVLRARLHLSGDTLDIDGSGPRALRPPAPSGLIVQGRRARARHRLAVGSMAAAASVLVAGAGLGVAGGVWQIPGLRDQGAGPAALEASRGTKVGDLVNDIDQRFSSYESAGPDLDNRTWRYNSGPALNPEADDSVLAESRKDRAVQLIEDGVGGEAANASFNFRWTDLTQGGSASGTRALGTLKLGDGGRGQWMRVRPSAQDGWLVLAVLPVGATSVQFRVEGSDVVLPLAADQVETDVLCVTGPGVDEVGDCTGAGHNPVVRVRIATTDANPPIDGITYIDNDGTYVALGAEALVR